MADQRGIDLSCTQRGFVRGEFHDVCGESCSIQESSEVGEARIWLGMSHPQVLQLTPNMGWSEYELPENVRGFSRMYLNQDMAAELVVLLNHFIRTGSLADAGEPK